MSYASSDLPISVQENMDAQVTVKVPATSNRKAYEYTKNTGGASVGGRKANVGLGVGLAVGSAAILGGLAAAAAKTKGDRDADRKKTSETAKIQSEEGQKRADLLAKRMKKEEAEYEAKNPPKSEEEVEAARKKSERIMKMAKLSPSEELLSGAFKILDKKKEDKDIKKKNKKEQIKKGGKGFARRNNSLYERIDSFVADFTSRV